MFLPKLALSIFPDWNSRIITSFHAKHYCSSKRICVVDCGDEIEQYGLYTVYKKKEFIVLNRNLDPLMKAWVWLHEIFHQKAHFPETSYFSKSMESKNDLEANIFAAVAMMPKPLLAGRSIDEICFYYDIPRPLAEIRMMVSENYQF
jgi:Zn-dependent peptidase ImmA (M78 family)